MGILHSYCRPCRISTFENDMRKTAILRPPRAISSDCKASMRNLSKIAFPFFHMSDEHKDILQKHFRKTLLEQRPDVFHKTMLLSIQSSPKLNEIIACQMYCFRDLTKWPKLNRMSEAQLSFFERLIHEQNLDSSAVSESVYQLGIIHYRYAKYGLKPHFLDIWNQHFQEHALKISKFQFLEKLNFENSDEKSLFEEAFRVLIRYIAETMNLAYSRCQQEAAMKTKEQQLTH